MLIPLSTKTLEAILTDAEFDDRKLPQTTIFKTLRKIKVLLPQTISLMHCGVDLWSEEGLEKHLYRE